MPTNTLDHRTYQQEAWGDIDVGIFAGLITANFDQVGPTLNLTATSGAAAGTTPPAAVIKPGSNAFRGNVTFGTGSATPAGGVVLTILFPVALTGLVNVAGNPQMYVFLQATTQATSAFGFAALFTTSGATVTGFTINTTGTLAASQANTVYGLSWLCMG